MDTEPASFVVTARSTAPPAAVFAVVADGSRWSEWAGPFVPESAWERQGEGAPGGVGAVRRLGRRPVFSREEIVVYEPPRRLSYVLLAGLPVRDYRADVELEPDGGGTSVRWSGRFSPKVPGTAALLRVGLRAVVRGFAHRLVREAERREGARPS